ncbi:hypothetical protein LCGC14_2660910, partial [marine sediment metagenome]
YHGEGTLTTPEGEVLKGVFSEGELSDQA